jgi:hypothetical protein
MALMAAFGPLWRMQPFKLPTLGQNYPTLQHGGVHHHPCLQHVNADQGPGQIHHASLGNEGHELTW